MVYNCLKNSLSSGLWHLGCCLGCRLPIPWGQDFCSHCHAALPWLDHACPRCAHPLPEEAMPRSLCGQCQQQAPPYCHVISPFLYQAPIDGLIHQFKYRRALFLGRSFAHCCAVRLGENDFFRNNSSPLLVPVPLHRSRLRERGYNQSLELAKNIARITGWKLNHRLLTRITNTPPQADLPLGARKKNVARAFASTSSFNHKHILLVDDVLTSGYTAASATKCLLDAGAAQVSVVVIARTGTSASY